MKTQTKSRRSLVARITVGLLITAGALLSSNCAYNEVMRERQAENQMLNQQLQAEQARGAALTKQ